MRTVSRRPGTQPPAGVDPSQPDAALHLRDARVLRQPELAVPEPSVPELSVQVPPAELLRLRPEASRDGRQALAAVRRDASTSAKRVLNEELEVRLERKASRQRAAARRQ